MYYSNSAGLALGLGIIKPYNFLRFQFEGEFGPLREDKRRKFNTDLQGYKISSFFDFFWDSLVQEEKSFFLGASFGLSYQDFIHESKDSYILLLELAKNSNEKSSSLFWKLKNRSLLFSFGLSSLWKKNSFIQVSKNSSYIRKEGFLLQVFTSVPVYNHYDYDKSFYDSLSSDEIRTIKNFGSMVGVSFQIAITAYVAP